MPNEPESISSKRAPGRPRAFDMEAALDGAVLVFRERGYNGASLADLCAEMKLANGSIYKAFRDKRGVFLAALDRYTTCHDAAVRSALDAAPCGRDKLHAMLAYYAGMSLGENGRRGCLVVAAAAELSTFDPEMADLVAAALGRVEARLLGLVQMGQVDGSIPSHLNAVVAAGALLCMLQGLRVVGKVGRTRAELMAVVGQAMRVLG